MLKAKRSIITSLAATAAIFSALLLMPKGGQQVHAATINEINTSAVFLKQQEYDTCTLCANVMMLRRAAILRGDSDWADITEYSAKSTLWVWGAGMHSSYTYRNMHVSSGRFGYDVASELIALLKEHPEGVVAYDYDRPHAILVTDYSDGEFYIADPAHHITNGRVKASEASIWLLGAEAYWVVDSPSLRVTGQKTTQTPEVKSVNELWKITTQGGLNLRTGAGTYYTTKGLLPYGTTVNITKITSVSGVQWGYVADQPTTGWIALSYAQKVVVKPITLTMSSSHDTLSLGSSVTVSASAAGGRGGYQYAFFVKKSTDSDWTQLNSYSSTCSFTFRPETMGSYALKVRVKDSAGSIKGEFLRVRVVKPLENNSRISTSEAVTGETVTLLGAASGGIGGYQYAYYYQLPTDKSLRSIRSFSSVTSVPFKPTALGDYTFTIKIKDSHGVVVKKTFKVVVRRALTNTSTISANNIRKGDAVLLYGSALGGAGNYNYAYYYRKTTENKWYPIRTYGKCSKVTFMPSNTGEYEVLIKVKDSDEAVAKRFFTLTVR